MANEFAKMWHHHPEIELIQAARPKVDFLKPETVKSVVMDVKPDVIVNAAAFTKVDLAESEREQSMRINADSVFALGEAAKKRDSLVVHFSSDYVFDGSKTSPYRESDAVNPINHYGLTKLRGEEALEAAQCDALILRVQWLYGEFGKNFYKTMLQMFQTKDQLSIVNDQTGTPTSTAWLAQQVDMVLNQKRIREKKGLYHLSPNGSCSWHEFAKVIHEFEKEKGQSLKCESLVATSTSDYSTPAKRPLYSVLDSQKFAQTFKSDIHDWKDLLRAVSFGSMNR